MKLAYPTATLLLLTIGCSGTKAPTAPAEAVPEASAPAADAPEEEATPEEAVEETPKLVEKELVKVGMGERSTTACSTLAKKRDRGLSTAYVEELTAVTRWGEISGGQMSGRAQWLDTEDLEDALSTAAQAVDKNTDEVSGALPVFVMGAAGVSETDAAVVRPMGVRVGLQTKRGDNVFGLATQTCAPSPDVRIDNRRLAEPTAGADKAATWAGEQEGEPFVAVGEVKGSFGLGVDRVVVVAPKQRLEPTDEASPEENARARCQSEFAIAMKGNRVKGQLSVVRTLGKKGAKQCEEGPGGRIFMEGLELAGVVDVDQNGTDELLWTYTASTGAATQFLMLSGVSNGALQTWRLGSYTYGGCGVFLDRNDCGRAWENPAQDD